MVPSAKAKPTSRRWYSFRNFRPGCRGTAYRSPLIVDITFWFNIGALYPHILGVRTVNLFAPVTVAVVGLTLHEAAYAAEVVRGGILSVDRGQFEAAQALGLSRWLRRRRIVLPQAMRAIVPAAANQHAPGVSGPLPAHHPVHRDRGSVMSRGRVGRRLGAPGAASAETDGSSGRTRPAPRTCGPAVEGLIA